MLVTSNADGSWNVEFRGALANQDVAALTRQANEVQRFTLPGGAAGGSFRLTFMGQQTSFIPANAAAGDVAAALEGLLAILPGDVVVTGVAGGPYDVEFRGQYANQDVQLLVAASNELQLLALPTAPTGGTFTLNFAGQTTGPIPVDASPAFVQLALEALSNIAVGDVLVTGSAGSLRVEFRQAFAGIDVPLITSDTSSTIGGITSGAYQLQIRLREVDELGGSTVRFAKIANAVNGIARLRPADALAAGGETGEVDNRRQQHLRRLAVHRQPAQQRPRRQVDRRRDLRRRRRRLVQLRHQLRRDPGHPRRQHDGELDGPRSSTSTMPTALARPNLVINVYDATGNLVLTSRDSNVADDRPTPLNRRRRQRLVPRQRRRRRSFIGPDRTAARPLLRRGLGRRPNAEAVHSVLPPPAPRLRWSGWNRSNSVQRIVEDHIDTTAA